MHKIAIFCHNLEINGANNVALCITRVLIKKYNVQVFSPKMGKSHSKFIKEGANVEIISESFNFNVLSSFSLVCVNSLMMSRIILEAQKRSVPNFLIVHETWDKDRLDYLLNDLWSLKDIKAEDIYNALKISEHVVFPAQYLNDVYADFVQPERRQTIYCTVEMKQIQKFLDENNRYDIRQSLGFKEDEIIFLQIGTVTKRKGQLKTVMSYCSVRNILGDKIRSKLLLVGARNFRDGESKYIEQIKDFIDSNSISDFVEIIPVQENIYSYLLASDIYIHPSINEVLPLAILEACYLKKAIITSNIDGMPEVITHCKNGILVDPFSQDQISDAMLLLAYDKELRIKLGESAYESLMRNHSEDKFENNYTDFVENLIAANYESR